MTDDKAIPTEPAPDLAEFEQRYRGMLRVVVASGDVPRNGQGGDAKTYRLLAEGLFKFHLPQDRVLAIFEEEINSQLLLLNDAWDRDELNRKLDRLVKRGPLEEYSGDSPESASPRRWDDAIRIAGRFTKTQEYVRVKKTTFEFDGSVYRVISDEAVDADVFKCCEAAAKEHHQKSEADWKKSHEADHCLAAQDVKDRENKRATTTHTEHREADAKLLDQARKRLAKLEKSRPKVIPSFGRDLQANVTAAVFAACQRPDNTQPASWLNGETGHYLAVATGLLSLDTFELREHTPSYFNLVVLPVGFDPKAPSPLRFLIMLSELMEGNAERLAVLQELAGACLDPWLKMKFFAALVGEGDNGKSVFLTVLRALFGAANISAVSLGAIARDKFAMFGMFASSPTSSEIRATLRVKTKAG